VSILWQTLSAIAPFAAGFAISAFFARRQKKALAEQKTETLRLLRAEFQYWQGVSDAKDADADQQLIVLGATGATSNVMAAVMGHPAPWHGYKAPKASVPQ